MVDRFLSYLRVEKNRSKRTIEIYGSTLRELETYFTGLDKALTWQTIDADIIRDWEACLIDKGQKAASINLRLSALRTFFRWALRLNLVSADPMRLVDGLKRHRPMPNFVREKDIDKLLDSRMWTDSYDDCLARTILIILYEAGLRVSELVGLNDADVSLVNHELKVTGKRNKQRVIPFGEELQETLVTYMSRRDAEVPQATGALLRSRKGERVKVGWVQNTVKRQLGRVTTQAKRSPHVLRHSFATALLNHEAGLESVRKLLGHESVATTEIYTHTTFEQLRKVYKNAHPRA